MKWGWVAGAAMALAGCGGQVVNSQYRPRDGNAVQSPFDAASPGDEVFSRQSDAFPLATVNLPNKPGEQPQMSSVFDVLNAPPAAPSIHPSPATEPAPTQILAGTTTMPEGNPALPTAATPQVALPVKVAAQDKQVGDVQASADASGNLELFVTSATGIGSVTLERTGESWPAKVNVHLAYGAGKPFSGISGASATELVSSGQVLPLKTSSSTSDVTVSVPGFTRSARIRIEWIDKYR